MTAPFAVGLDPIYSARGRMAVLLVVALFLPISTSAQEKAIDPALKERFLKEAPAAWEEYGRRAEYLQGKVSFQATFREGVDSRHRYELRKNAQCKSYYAAMESIGAEFDGHDYVKFLLVVINPKYGFRLSRDADNAPWTIVDPSFQKAGAERFFDDYYKELKWNYYQLVSIPGHFLLELIRSPDFRVNGCRPLEAEGEKLAEIVFDRSTKEERETVHVIRGTLVVDSDRLWALKSYNVEEGWDYSGGKSPFRPARTHIVNITQYGETRSGLPVPKRADVTTLTPLDEPGKGGGGKGGPVKGGADKGPRGGAEKPPSEPAPDKKAAGDQAAPKPAMQTVQRRFEYDLDIPDPLPGDEEFTLSAFGLPEPTASQAGWAWPIWAVVLAVACLAAGALLYRHFRRRQSAG